MKPATEILLSAAFVLTPPENWTQNYMARNKRGDGRYYSAPDAVCWCVVGAMLSARRALDAPGYDAALDFLDMACGMNRVTFNNTHTHAEVLDALYRAAEIAEKS